MARSEPWPENMNCERTYASFRLLSDTLEPHEVTAVLGVEPSFAARKGSAPGRSGHVARTGVWIISTKELVDSTNLERHIVALLEILEPVAAELRVVADRFDAFKGFFCYWESKTGHGGPDFGAETLARIAGLDAELGLDFYAPDWSPETID